jgi:hypothetical protein
LNHEVNEFICFPRSPDSVRGPQARGSELSLKTSPVSFDQDAVLPECKSLLPSRHEISGAGGGPVFALALAGPGRAAGPSSEAFRAQAETEAEGHTMEKRASSVGGSALRASITTFGSAAGRRV